MVGQVAQLGRADVGALGIAEEQRHHRVPPHFIEADDEDQRHDHPERHLRRGPELQVAAAVTPPAPRAPSENRDPTRLF